MTPSHDSPSHDSPFLTCHLNIMRLMNNLDDLSLPAGNLFVRYYVSVGRKRRIRIDTREIPSTSQSCSWNELASLECRGATRELFEQRSIVFELRWRPERAKRLFTARSKLLGRGEIAWKDVMGVSTVGVSSEKRINFAATRWPADSKSPTLLVRMEVKGLEATKCPWKECDCQDCNRIKEDLFAAAHDLCVF